MTLTVLHIVRHAQPESGEEANDPGLDDLGRRQALALGERLRRVPVADVVHGPSRRTTQTAELVAAALPGVVPQLSDHLRDRTPVPPPGQDELVESRYHSWFAGVPEVERDVGGAAIDAAMAHFGAVGATDRHVVLVTHSFVLGWAVRRALRLPWDGWMALQPLPAALTVVAVRDAAEPVLVAYNDAGHLTGPLRTGDPLQLDL